MSKGVLGLGCSYTWGEGLYFYSDLDELPFRETHTFDSKKIRKSMELFKDKHRYLQKVADYLDTWCWSDYCNGGSQWDTVQYVDELEEKYNFKYNDFSLVILQFSQHFRQFTKFDLDIKKQILEIDLRLKKFEELNIKTVTISWDFDITNHPTYKKLFKERHVDLIYEGKTYEHFYDLTKENKYGLSIASDFSDRGLQKNDEHFNLKGHKIVAESIIKKLDIDRNKI